MELKNQVVSLELSKKLKDLWVEQNSLFYHDIKLEKVAWSGDIQSAPVDFKGRYYSAFTVAELGEMLPQLVSSYRYEKWTCTMTNSSEMTTYTANTEADARAKMLIYLLENNLLKDRPRGTALVN